MPFDETTMSQNLSVCVIGAGGAGLCAIKHAVDHGLQVSAFELAKEIGGTWVYSDVVGKDKYGNDVHSSMYKDLVTNTPKEIMGYPNLPFPNQENSYITSENVLCYYHWYAAKFDILKHIKFEHNVLRVRSLANKTWEVVVMDLKSNACQKLHFNAVMVCNGHNSTPNIPKINGQEIFVGKQLHSHDFRSADDFKDQRVCIVGAGPSALEMVLLISKVAAHVTWSHHSKRPSIYSYCTIAEQKPDILSISNDNVTFTDGTTQSFSALIYATGYLYTFPFLSVDCGVSVVDDCIQPLYKFCISVHQPTLAFIGLINLICPNVVFDLQSRFFFTFLTKQKVLPSIKEMLNERETSEFKEIGLVHVKSFPLNSAVHINYIEALAAEANIDSVKPVIFKICEKALHNAIHNVDGYRNVKFRIIDDDSYEIVA